MTTLGPASGRHLLASVLAALTTACAVAWHRPTKADELFETAVRPVLTSHCIRCHGESKQEGGLNLATATGVATGGDSGPTIVPGRPDQSLLLAALRHESLEMPPTGKLEPAVIAGVARWVAAGASWPEGIVLTPADPLAAADRDWWCYKPIAAPPVPAPPPGQADWCLNEIDRFVSAKLAERGIAPAPAAAPAALLRRLHFAATGLPPGERLLQETDGGRAVLDPGAAARLVDAWLDSPAYGEHQARHWLDLVRYADSDGYRADGARPHAKQYRDYVIGAFNADKPYDRFVLEQIAGDEIDPGNRDAIVGTMFLRHWIYEWNQRDVEGQWQKILDDLTETTADVFLAQSLKCARCHDHKFDPLLQKDYYRLQAFFAAFLPTEAQPIADLPARAEHASRQRAWESATASIRRRLDEIERPALLAHATGERPTMFPPEVRAMIEKRPADRTPYEHQIAELAARQFKLHPDKLEEWLAPAASAERTRLLELLAAHESLKPEPLPTQAFAATDVGPTAPVTRIPDDRTKTPVDPGFLTLLDARPATIEPAPPALGTTGRRTALARWIASPENPLTARVIVNRVWQQHFGRGLAASASDFGHLGPPPTHPELLDWLAMWFIREGWSLKKLHRLILTSATFRQTSERPLTDHITAVDPENKLLWRMQHRRLSGEEITDAVLAAAGAVTTTDTEQRAIYKPVRRNSADPVLAAFDLPDRIQSAGERHRTTTPMQALLLTNGTWAHEQARAITRGLHDLSDEDFIATVHRRLFGREAAADELSDSTAFLDAYPSLGPDDTSRAIAATVTDMPARVGKAVTLSPEGRLAIDLLDAGGLPDADFTVRAIVVLRSLYEDAKVRTIAATWSGNPKEPGWSFGVTSAKSRYRPRNLILQLVGKTEDAENIHYEVVPSNLRLELDKPYFVAVSVDLDDPSEQGIHFFVRDLSRKGAPLETAAAPHEVNRFSEEGSPLQLGRRADGHGWDGLVARLQIDAARLSAAEVEAGASRSPVLDWRFDDPSRLGRDASAGGRHARVSLAAPTPLAARDAARAALVHALLNANELLYLD